MFHSSPPPQPRRRPTIVFGGSASILGSPRRTIRQAHHEGYLALDLDLRNALVAPSPTAFRSLADDQVLRIRSVWLPPAVGGPFLERRLDRLTAFIRHAQQELGLRHVVIAGANRTTAGGTSMLQLVQAVFAGEQGSVRLALGVRADRSLHPLHGTALARRTAEEWDMDLALDVAGPVPPGWEAEAAVARLLPRLTVVRLCGWLPTQVVHVDESPTRIAARSMAMLADQGYAGLLSIVPTRHRRPSTDYQHDLQRRYDVGPHSADAPAWTHLDLP